MRETRSPVERDRQVASPGGGAPETQAAEQPRAHLGRGHFAATVADEPAPPRCEVRHPRRRLRVTRAAAARWWPWAGGVAVAVAVLGPALGPGALLGLDVVLVPRIPVPSGVWGLGPELSRRLPFGLLLSWAAPVGGSVVVGKAFLAASLAAAFAGACRLARGAPVLARVGAGLVYAASPYLLTRTGAGHLGLVAAAGLLPFALPSLLAPGERPRRTFLWAAALGATGYSGGILAVLAVVVGLALNGARKPLAVAGSVVLAQMWWLVPGLVVIAGGPTPAGAASFATDAPGLLGPARVLAGHGFWRASSQVGGAGGTGVALLGLGLGLLAVLGARDLPSQWRRPGAALAAVGLALALASAVPVVRDAFNAFSTTPLGAPLRESQRFAVLTLVWLAPAAAFGAARLGGTAMHAMPAAAAVALALPGLWGLGGRLQAVPLPASWEAARREVTAHPGTVVALPWHRYLDLRVAGGLRVFNPLPDLLGGDVVFSSDPALGGGHHEGTDPRERHVAALVEDLRDGRPVAGDLARLGVRWVALLRDVDWRAYAGALAADEGLEPRVRSGTLELFRVRAWRGPVTDAAGRPVPMSPVVAPLRRLAPSGPARWAQPATRGWMRGTSPAGRTPDGLVRLPAGRGWVWFWPAPVSVAAQVAVALAVAASLWADRARATVSAPRLPTGAGGTRPWATPARGRKGREPCGS